MKQYTDLLREIVRRGRVKQNRTGVDTISLIDAPQMVFDMDDGFPLLTERPIFFRGVVGENIWFLKGICNNEDLLAQNIKIWDKWALKQDTPVRQLRDLGEMVDEYTEIRHRELGVEEMSMEAMQKTSEIVQAELKAADDEDEAKGLPVLAKKLDAKTPEELHGGFRLLREKNVSPYTTLATMPKGYLGPIYGVLWRAWPGLTEHEYFDQIKIMLDKLGSDNPKLRYSRANIVTAFHPALLPDETQNAETNILQGRQALAACHTMFQLFAEPLTEEERAVLLNLKYGTEQTPEVGSTGTLAEFYDEYEIPRDRLSLKLYQRKHNCALAA